MHLLATGRLVILAFRPLCLIQEKFTWWDHQEIGKLFSHGTAGSSLWPKRLVLRPQRYNRHNIKQPPNGRAAKPAGGARPASSIPAFPAPPRSLFSRVSMVERARRRLRRPWCGRVGPLSSWPERVGARRGAMSEKKQPVDLGLLEEDDEFEEFPAEGERRGLGLADGDSGFGFGGSGAARAPGPGAPAGSLDPAAGPGGSAHATLRAPGFGLVASGFPPAPVFLWPPADRSASRQWPEENWCWRKTGAGSHAICHPEFPPPAPSAGPMGPPAAPRGTQPPRVPPPASHRPNHWTGLDEDEDAHVWEDNWDDDNVEDDFSNQLRLNGRRCGRRWWWPIAWLLAAVFRWPPADRSASRIGVPLGVADRTGGRHSDRRVVRGKLLLAENWCRQPAGVLLSQKQVSQLASTVASQATPSPYRDLVRQLWVLTHATWIRDRGPGQAAAGANPCCLPWSVIRARGPGQPAAGINPRCLPSSEIGDGGPGQAGTGANPRRLPWSEIGDGGSGQAAAGVNPHRLPCSEIGDHGPGQPAVGFNPCCLPWSMIPDTGFESATASGG
ncbi:hypothetical protein QTO34_004461 [Cnephaeus nilssonii]|uniref:26S proteasome complex subunit SEM1 n=1 Tax=Cnephaeus nilssonii TaxID=3371016 RepID=A0AA40LJD5_CNENI|nr:hypothetical protein QTO34_004461 [Eptesicus nilssonii]